MSSSEETVSFQIANGVEIPKPRSVEDFLLDSARFEAPPLSDLSRWNNRIVSNLLYYQTNYFVIFFSIFLILSFFNSKDFVIGLLAVVALGGTGYYALSHNSMFIQTRRDHPLLTLGAIVVSFYFFIYTIQVLFFTNSNSQFSIYGVLESVLVLVFSILVPLIPIMLHASMRLRNFRSKINQQAERLGLKTTVMSRLLELAGVDVKA